MEKFHVYCCTSEEEEKVVGLVEGKSQVRLNRAVFCWK